MKKLIVLFFIVVVLFYSREDSTLMTFNEVDDSYHIYTITKEYLNTKNVYDYLSDDSILYLETSLIKDYIKYPFSTNQSLKYNINHFEEYCIDLADSYANIRDKYIMYGVPIKSITIYMSTKRLNELISLGFSII